MSPGRSKRWTTSDFAVGGKSNKENEWRARPLIASAVLLCVAIALQPTTALGQDSPATDEKRVLINLPLLLSERYIGDAAVEISSDQSAVFVQTDDIERLLGPQIEPETLKNILAAADPNGFVSKDGFDANGLILQFDPSTLEIKVSLPVDLARVGTVAVSPQEDPANLANFIEPERVAGAIILNYEQAIDYDEPGAAFEAPAALAELSLALGGSKGVYLFSQLQYDGERQSAFARGPTLLVHDDTENVLRYSFGDVLPDVRGFQTAPQIGGFGFQRSYEVLQPNRNVRPAGQFRFQLDEPAIVEINVNGAPTRVLRLERGQYDLRDFNFITGANQVEIFVIDDFGRRSVAVFDQFFDFNLLTEGLDEFGFFVGPRQNQADGGFDYDFDDIVMTGFYRRGISDTLTLGTNFQAESGRFMVGASTLTALPIGTVALASAFSSDRAFGNGYRLLTSYEKFSDRIGIFEFPNINFEAEYISPRFTSVGQPFFLNDVKFDLRARATGAIGGRVGVGVAATYSVRRNGLPDRYNFSTNVGTSIGKLNFNARAEHARFDDGRTENRLIASVGLRLGQRSTFRASHDTRDSRSQIDFARFRNEVLNDFGVRANIVREDGRSNGLAEFSYNQNRALLTARHEAIGDASLGNLRHRSVFSASTQISFAGAKVAMARPVGPRFVMVSSHETLDSQVQIRRGINVEQLESESGGFGPGVGTAGDAYTQRQITVRAPDAPPGYDVGETVFTLYPPPVAGYNIQLGSDASYSISGTLVDGTGEVVSLLAGQAVSLDRQDAEPVRFFTNRSGRFVAYGLVPGRHRISMGSGRLTAVINVTETEIGTIDLGEVIVEEAVSDG